MQIIVPCITFLIIANYQITIVVFITTTIVTLCSHIVINCLIGRLLFLFLLPSAINVCCPVIKMRSRSGGSANCFVVYHTLFIYINICKIIIHIYVCKTCDGIFWLHKWFAILIWLKWVCPDKAGATCWLGLVICIIATRITAILTCNADRGKVW